jgi:hypothetical protein
MTRPIRLIATGTELAQLFTAFVCGVRYGDLGRKPARPSGCPSGQAGSSPTDAYPHSKWWGLDR